MRATRESLNLAILQDLAFSILFADARVVALRQSVENSIVGRIGLLVVTTSTIPTVMLALTVTMVTLVMVAANVMLRVERIQQRVTKMLIMAMTVTMLVCTCMPTCIVVVCLVAAVII